MLSEHPRSPFRVERVAARKAHFPHVVLSGRQRGKELPFRKQNRLTTQCKQKITLQLLGWSGISRPALCSLLQRYRNAPQSSCEIHGASPVFQMGTLRYRGEAELRHCLTSAMSLHHIQVPSGNWGEVREGKKRKPAFINIPS